MKTRYRWEAKSIVGFVQQIACAYLRHGYWFYVIGQIPSGKDLRIVDEKLIAKYDIAVSESTRGRRKKQGWANLQYLRYERTFVIFATLGQHLFKELEADALRDIRHVPLKIHGYSISYRQGGRTRKGELDSRWHAHVEIERTHYRTLQTQFQGLARNVTRDRLAFAFYQLPFEPYAPIRRQFLRLLRDVNRVRQRTGKPAIAASVLPMRRRIVRPFDDTE